MKKLYGSILALVIAMVAIFAVGAASNETGITASAQEVSSAVDTASAIAGAEWSDDVSIIFDSEANTFRFQSNGMPDHGFADQYLIPNNVASQPFADNSPDQFTVVNSAEYFTETEVDTTITTQPIYAVATTQTSLGRIGVALSGAQLFNDYENMERSIVAMDDNVIHDHVPFVDACNGHTLVDGTSYHYHGIPVCISQDVDQAGEHSAIIGVLEDGFPVYANQGQNGVIVTNADLDECSGHFGVTPEFADGIYHYHLTADEAPYMVDCYHGEIEVTANNGPGPGGPDFAAIAASLGVTENALRDSLGASMPPNFEAAATKLGISLTDLMAAMPRPPQ